MPLPPSETTRTPIPNTGGTSSSMTNNKRKFNSNSMTSSHNGTKKVRLTTDDTPLTDGQRRFLDQNIAQGGGIVLSEAVQNKTAWIKEARHQNLCINCAGSGPVLHGPGPGPRTSQSRSRTDRVDRYCSMNDVLDPQWRLIIRRQPQFWVRYQWYNEYS
jgi:hypothetical protein